MKSRLDVQNSSRLSIVFQGPKLRELTENAIVTTRKSFPLAEIIYSTYIGTDCSDLIKYLDIVIYNLDLGYDEIHLSGVISGTKTNAYRMIKTSLNGIEASTREVVVRLRSDTILHNPKILQEYVMNASHAQSFRNKILVCKIMDPKWLKRFYVGDWVQMGLKDDLCYLYRKALEFFDNKNFNKIDKKLYTSKNESRIVPEIVLWNSLFSDFSYLSNKINFNSFVNENLLIINNTNNSFFTVQKYPKHFVNPFFNFKNISYKRYYEIKPYPSMTEKIKIKLIRTLRSFNYIKKRILK